ALERQGECVRARATGADRRRPSRQLDSNNLRRGVAMSVRGNLSTRFGGWRTCATMVGLGGLALAAIAASCGSPARALLLIDVIGDQIYSGVNVTLTANGQTTK